MIKDYSILNEILGTRFLMQDHRLTKLQDRRHYIYIYLAHTQSL